MSPVVPAQTEAPILPIRPHLLSARQAAQQLQVHPEHGLHGHEIEGRRSRHGSNELPGARASSWGRRLLDAFGDFMILALLAAAGVAWAMGEHTDTVVILVIVLLNGIISLVQQHRADQALAALGRLAAPSAVVRRDGHTVSLPARELVPGDVVLLEAGNLVPADLRLIHAAQLRVDESALTGESVPVDKHADVLPPSAADPDGEHAVADRLNLAYRGTLVTHGRAEGLVVATGSATQLGQVAALLDLSGMRDTPLQRRLASFGKQLSLVVLLICAAVFALGLLRGEPLLPMMLTAISLAVAAIPEALPAVTAVLLALGARRLAAVNALVKRLPAVETLGSVSTVCSDKTGTLTQNRMQVASVHLLPDDAPAPGRTAEAALWRAVVLCNDARRRPEIDDDKSQGSTNPGDPSAWLGDPTETALIAAASAAGRFDIAALQRRLPRCHEWPFDANRKCMSTLHPRHREAGWLQITKGAPEALLPLCIEFPSLPQDAALPSAAGASVLDEPSAQRAAWLALAQGLASQGLRVLAITQRRWPGETAIDTLRERPVDRIEQSLELLGLIGLNDPPRPEAADAVRQCRRAGITPVMITGDHPATALAIARQLGIVGPVHDEPRVPGFVVTAGDSRELVLTGSDLARMSDPQLEQAATVCRVYARVDPAQKVRIVQALQAAGAYVAMTGDGVNDAPALQRADIGVAMGRNGTDVARQAASLVLLDDRFATIVSAVREGRRIFDNIRKFVRYALTGNSAEIWLLFLAPLLGMPLPLLPVHILWVNLVTDGLPGLALAAEPAEPGVMQRPPRPPAETLFAHGLWQHCLWVGLLMGGLCLGLQAWAMHSSPAAWQTMVFTAITMAQMGHVLVIRSESQPLWQQGLRSNLPLTGAVVLTFALQLAVVYLPPLQQIFHTTALGWREWMASLGCAAVVMVAVEAEKGWRRRRTALTPAETPSS